MEFKEAMKAHAIYGYPKFLFKDQHKGKMVWAFISFVFFFFHLMPNEQFCVF